MHRILLALAFSTLIARPTATPEETAVMLPIHQFLDAFNTGDVKAAIAVCSDITTIIDEFAPYEWHGAGTCSTWMDAYDVNAKQNGIADGHVTFGSPRHLDITGENAYVVLPADYTYVEKGTPMHEAGSSITITLKKGAGKWRMTAWSWAKH